ncbi:XisI protein [Oscillatoriales cyanobacterium LEGE 11467]|uniref:XisI protein n=1 Tax=Zarconia navalis LEGE 11467 TaxID=1828826 RepID=A0A928Z7M9_9CYAN|nr:XisI protein [Zarconia navalis]MBE9041602.1 XisI protein [Zarconia navalis LEGE 11467]
MDRLEQYRTEICTVFNQYLKDLPSKEQNETIAICDEKTDNYLLMNVGWNGYQRQHGIFFHLRIIEEKIHIEWNGTEEIVENLIEQGIPESAFIPAFRHPDFRAELAIV